MCSIFIFWLENFSLIYFICLFLPITEFYYFWHFPLLFLFFFFLAREELAKILEHQGLEEIIDYSRLEQVAFLLAERAQLLDELEVLQDQKKSTTTDASIQADDVDNDFNKNPDNLNKTTLSENSTSKDENIIEKLAEDAACALSKSHITDQDKNVSFINGSSIIPCGMDRVVSKSTSTEDLDSVQLKEVLDASTCVDGQLELGGDLQKLLEKERKEFEDQLQKQHEFWQMNEKKLKDEHEEEVNTVLEENERLEEELSETRLKVSFYSFFSLLLPFKNLRYKVVSSWCNG